MKRLFYVLAAFLLTFSANQLNAQVNPACSKVAVAPTIDGDLVDWDLTESYHCPNISYGTTNILTTDWDVKWDDDNLYLRVSVNDADFFPSPTGTEAGDGDGIAIAIGKPTADKNEAKGWGLGANKYASLLYRLADGTVTNRLEWLIPNVEAACILTDGVSYVWEVKIPWASVGGYTPQVADVLLFELQVLDRNTGAVNEQGYSSGNTVWDGTWGSFVGTGDMTLGDIGTSVNSPKMDELSFSVYPNPSYDNLNVKIASDIQNIKVYSPAGQMLSNTKVDNKREFTLNVESFDAGLYLLQVQTKEGVFTQQFMKK